MNARRALALFARHEAALSLHLMLPDWDIANCYLKLVYGR
ncbi:protein of unknown function [Xenorhabdus poinarii G6]|uniref:Uncharacterized protein n=1 Tax=Xenorhabdus poinarii G6 TaxID=1354304 RepID=A0A068R4H3_9GAMM|nr:protein of unknown function [Xenorhabdus poinarii G6]